MRACHKLLRLSPVLFLLGTLSAVVLFADIAPKDYPLRIKVLSVESQALSTETQVPKDCDFQNYSAYCNESKNSAAQNIMLVQAGDGRSLRLACASDARWSKCSVLSVGETYEAREEKHGIAVLYRNVKGKEKKRFYQLVAAVRAPELKTVPSPEAAPAPQPPVAVPAPASPQDVSPGNVTVNFSSTPAGAEITLDGKYVGNTPSTIVVNPGAHDVVLSLPGFVQWRRELNVSSGSAVNLTASLHKEQP